MIDIVIIKLSPGSIGRAWRLLILYMEFNDWFLDLKLKKQALKRTYMGFRFRNLQLQKLKEYYKDGGHRIITLKACG